MNDVQLLTVTISTITSGALTVGQDHRSNTGSNIYVSIHNLCVFADTHRVVPPWGLAVAIEGHARNIKRHKEHCNK
jgi:hypothetical protein